LELIQEHAKKKFLERLYYQFWIALLKDHREKEMTEVAAITEAEIEISAETIEEEIN